MSLLLSPLRIYWDSLAVLLLGPIQLLQQLVGLVKAAHGIQGTARIRMVFKGHLSVRLPDLGQCDPLAGVRWQLELAEGTLQGHG